MKFHTPQSMGQNNSQPRLWSKQCYDIIKVKSSNRDHELNIYSIHWPSNYSGQENYSLIGHGNSPLGQSSFFKTGLCCLGDNFAGLSLQPFISASLCPSWPVTMHPFNFAVQSHRWLAKRGQGNELKAIGGCGGALIYTAVVTCSLLQPYSECTDKIWSSGNGKA